MPRVNHRHNAIQSKILSQFGRFERVHHWIGISQASGFNEHVIKAFLFAEQFSQAADKVTPNAATQTAIVKFEDFFIDSDD
jgi:hypothetical protein